LAEFPVHFVKQFVSCFFGVCTKFYYQNSVILLFSLHFTKNIAHNIAEASIFYADKPVLMGNSKNSRVFNFAILLKSQKFYAHEIYVLMICPTKLQSHL